MSEVTEALRRAKRPHVLTGAGISAPSGVPTFQSSWKGRPIRSFLGRDYLERDPVGFFELYCSMEAWTRVEPNEAHRALARLGIPVITQNIDGLHQKAGSREVIELHGNLRSLVCRRCGKTVDAAPVCGRLRPLYEQGAPKAAVLEALRCTCGGRYDPDVVLYGDAVRGISEAWEMTERCDLLLVIGTSLETYPAAALPDVARSAGIPVVIENRDCVGAFRGAQGTFGAGESSY